MTKEEMTLLYHKFSAVSNYIIVAENKELVKFKIYSMLELIKFDCFTTTTSSKGENMLRLLVSNDLKKDVLKNGIELTSYTEKEQIKNDMHLNNGETSEYLIFKHFNQNYHRDNIPFYEKGDINVNGIEFQVKSHKACFATEKQLNALKSKAV